MKSSSYDRLQEPSNDLAYPASSYAESISLKDYDDQRRTLVPSPFAPSIASQFGKSLPTTPKQKANRWCTWSSVQNGWLWEILSLAISVSATAGIVGVLVYFDGRTLPSWPYSITLNALVSILATISKAALLLPISEGLSQLKWLWFRSGRKPLEDFDKFDQASRGPWGSASLVFHLRARHFASIGALVTVITLAIDPFVQQTIGYKSQSILHPGMYPVSFRAESYDDRGPGHSGIKSAGNSVEGSMLSAIYRGIFAPSRNDTQRPAQAAAESCATGNCTFPLFTSLAVCSSCTNITSLVKKNVGTQEICDGDGCTKYNVCNDSLPNQIALRNVKNDDGYSNISVLEFFPQSSKSLIYQHIQNPLAVFDFLKSDVHSSTFDGYKPWALECALYWCVQTYNTTIISGSASEKIIGTWTDDSIPSGRAVLKPPSTFYQNQVAGGINDSQLSSSYKQDGILPNNITITSDEYTVRENATFKIRNKFFALFEEGLVSAMISGGDTGRLDFSSDMMQALYFAENIVSTVENLANSMTSQIRLQADNSTWVYGRSTNQDTLVQVRWAWLTLQLLATVLAMVFVLTATLRGSPAALGVWKSNALASLFHGLDPETQDLLNRGRTVGEMRQGASGVSVRLASGNDGVKLSAIR